MIYPYVFFFSIDICTVLQIIFFWCFQNIELIIIHFHAMVRLNLEAMNCKSTEEKG